MKNNNSSKPMIIVIGNEKGGAGKTTTAMHLITSMMYLGFKITSIDTDVRQASLSTYIANRLHTKKELNSDIPMPEHYKISSTEDSDKELVEILKKSVNSDFIVIDTPGTSNKLSNCAHSYADIIITPINDSFVDLDLLANVDGTNLSVIRPGIYSQMIWEQKMQKASRDKKSIEWIIIRNRISAIDTHNKRNVEKVLDSLSKRVGCKIAPGFGERVIFRELFLKGLTLLDVKNASLNFTFTTSHIIARQELLGLLNSLNIPSVQNKLSEVMI